MKAIDEVRAGIRVLVSECIESNYGITVVFRADNSYVSIAANALPDEIINAINALTQTYIQENGIR